MRNHWSVLPLVNQKDAFASFAQGGFKAPNIPFPWKVEDPRLTHLSLDTTCVPTCQMACKSVKRFKHGARLWQTDDRQTDHATEKCAATCTSYLNKSTVLTKSQHISDSNDRVNNISEMLQSYSEIEERRTSKKSWTFLEREHSPLSRPLPRGEGTPLPYPTPLVPPLRLDPGYATGNTKMTKSK